jgi:hypothetical protein
MKSRTVHLLVAVCILALSGIVHGMWTNRWGTGSNLAGKNLLDGLDNEIVNWRGEFLRIDPAPRTHCDSRRFEPVKAGKAVVVSVTSGSPGDVAVHTPDVCFLGAGWKLRGAVGRQTIPLVDGKNAAFWMADFTKTGPTGAETIRVRWSWTADGTWDAPDYPRWIFARAPILYKFYLVHPLPDDADLTREDPYRKFAAELMPKLSFAITH